MERSHFVTVSSLYRKFLRQVRRLPDVYLHHFFRLKLADDTRSILVATDAKRIKQRISRFSKELRKVEAANKGDHKAFAHILDLAYGRKGKLRWEIMEPLLSDPSVPLPPPIIKGKPKSRPPVYSSELAALLTSSAARKKHPIRENHMRFPPDLPPRADPSSPEAELLGPFSKRREVNIRWRFFTKEWKKVRPPIQLTCKERSEEDGTIHDVCDESSLCRVRVRPIGMQDAGVLKHIQRLAGPPIAGLTRRERCTSRHPRPDASQGHSRWVRRRYRELLGRLPILTYFKPRDIADGTYRASLHPCAIAPHVFNREKRLLPQADEVDATWLQSESLQASPVSTHQHQERL